MFFETREPHDCALEGRGAGGVAGRSSMEKEWNLNVVVQPLSCVQCFATPWTAARQASLSITISQSLLKLMSIKSVIPSNHLILCRPVFLLPSIFPNIRVFSNESALLYQVTIILEFQLQHQSFQWIFRTNILSDGLVGSPCSPRDSQESSPTPQFKSINSLPLSLLCDPTFTSVHDYWKSHSFDNMDVCQQTWFLCFLIYCLGWSYLFLQGASKIC